MAATQGVVPTATDVPQPRSRALTAAIIAVAVLAALTLAGLFGASAPGDGSRRSLTPYDSSRSDVVNENPLYPATGNHNSTR